MFTIDCWQYSTPFCGMVAFYIMTINNFNTSFTETTHTMTKLLQPSLVLISASHIGSGINIGKTLQACIGIIIGNIGKNWAYWYGHEPSGLYCYWARPSHPVWLVAWTLGAYRYRWRLISLILSGFLHSDKLCSVCKTPYNCLESRLTVRPHCLLLTPSLANNKANNAFHQQTIIKFIHEFLNLRKSKCLENK